MAHTFKVIEGGRTATSPVSKGVDPDLWDALCRLEKAVKTADPKRPPVVPTPEEIAWDLR